MKQIIVIHGGTTFADYDAYLNNLQAKEISAERFIHTHKWKETLQDNLGDGYQVLLPVMPNTTNARYIEWKIWFDRISQIADEDCILIGHSLGGVFLAKYLSQYTFRRRIRATILVAAPFDHEGDEDLTEFKIDSVSDLFSEQAGEVIFYNGSDDPVIPIQEMESYKKSLPTAEFNVVSAPDHFVRSAFPELVDRIIRLS